MLLVTTTKFGFVEKVCFAWFTAILGSEKAFVYLTPLENQFIVNKIEVSLRILRFPNKGNIKITITMFREETTSALLLEYWNLEMLEILEYGPRGGGNWRAQRNTFGARREPTTNVTHIWH